MEYYRLFEELYHNNIRYLICGGLAVNIYGIPRMTADIDIVLDFEAQNVKRFEAAVKKLEYSPTIPVLLSSLVDKAARADVIKNKNLIAFSYYSAISNYMTLDVLIKVPMSFEEMWKEKATRKMRDIEVNLVSVNDLIALKEFSNRAQDQNDIILLSKLKK